MRYAEIQTNLFENKPITIDAWHGTSDPNVSFRPWAHFGTARAAAQRLLFRMQRAKDYEWLIQTYFVSVSLTFRKKVIRVTDDAGFHLDPNTIIKKLLAKKISNDLRTALDGVDSSHATVMLLAHGIDGFVYRNKSEDKGSDSYVVLDTKLIQIKSVQPISKEQLEEIYWFRKPPDQATS